MTYRRGSLLLLSIACAPACGDDATQADGGSSDSGSSTGSPTATTLEPSSSGVVDESSTSGAVDSDSSESGSTTGSVNAGADIRVLYSPDTIANSHTIDGIDFVDGVASAPETVVETLGPGTYQTIGERWLAVSATTNAAVTAVDVHAQPVATWLLESAEAAVLDRVVASDHDGNVWVVNSSDGATADLYVHVLADDGPGAPWQVDGDLDPTTSSGEVALVQGDTRVAFRAFDDDSDTASIWLGPANAEAPELLSLVATPGVALFGPDVAPTGDGLVYRIGGLAGASSEAWYVDLASDPIADPQPLGLLPDKQSFASFQLAPDGSGIAVAQAEGDGTTDLAWFAIDDGVAAAPVQLSTGAIAGNAPFTPAWSPDSRWLAFSSDTPRTLHLLPFTAGAPGEAAAVTGDGIVTDVVPEFAPDSSHAYFVAVSVEGKTELSTVTRVALLGDAPGEPEPLSPAFERFGFFVVSSDSGSLCYIGAEAFEDPLRLWCVDVSGEAAGEPVQIDDDLDAELEEQVVTVTTSQDGSYVLYGVVGRDGVRKVLFDRTAGLGHRLADDEPSGYSELFELR